MEDRGRRLQPGSAVITPATPAYGGHMDRATSRFQAAKAHQRAACNRDVTRSMPREARSPASVLRGSVPL